MLYSIVYVLLRKRGVNKKALGSHKIPKERINFRKIVNIYNIRINVEHPSSSS